MKSDERKILEKQRKTLILNNHKPRVPMSRDDAIYVATAYLPVLLPLGEYHSCWVYTLRKNTSDAENRLESSNIHPS